MTKTMPTTALDFHRILVHFPVALILLAALFQALAVWRRSAALQTTARANLVAGAALGIVTALTGFLASREFSEASLEAHETAAWVTVGIAAVVSALWLWKPAEPRARGGWLALAGVCLAALSVGVTGWLGGAAAFGHGAHGPAAHSSKDVAPATYAPGVTDLPADIQPAYALFAETCNKCHGIDRALRYALPAAGWTRLVRAMADKTDGDITPAMQGVIVEFLQFYSAHRDTRLPPPPPPPAE